MAKQIWKVLFAVYMVLVVIFIVVKFNGNIYQLLDQIQINIHSRKSDPHSGINLVPFRTIGAYTGGVISSVSFINILGNIIPFMPMGFLLPMAFHAQRKMAITMVTCFFIIVSIEVIQYVTYLGAFDIDDIILNIISCLLGFLLFKMYSMIFREYAPR